MSGDLSEKEYTHCDTDDESEIPEVFLAGVRTPSCYGETPDNLGTMTADAFAAQELTKRLEEFSDTSGSTTDNSSSPMSQAAHQDGVGPIAFPSLPGIEAFPEGAQRAPAAPAGTTPSTLELVALKPIPSEDQFVQEIAQRLDRPIIHHLEGNDLEAHPTFQAGAVIKDQFVALKNLADGNCLFYRSFGSESLAPILEEAKRSFGAGEAELRKLRAGGKHRALKICGKESVLHWPMSLTGDQPKTQERIKTKNKENSSKPHGSKPQSYLLLWKGPEEERNNLCDQRRKSMKWIDVDELVPVLGADPFGDTPETKAPWSSAAGSEAFSPAASSSSDASLSAGATAHSSDASEQCS